MRPRRKLATICWLGLLASASWPATWGCSPAAPNEAEAPDSYPPVTPPPVDEPPDEPPPEQPERAAYQLTLPKGAEEMMQWSKRVGCRLLSEDGESYACLVGGEPDMGFTAVGLSVFSLLDGSKLKEFDLYDGRMEVEEQGVKPGFEEANAYLREHGFGEVYAESDWSVTTEKGSVVVERNAIKGSRALPEMPTSAPTKALEKVVDRCCKWTVKSHVVFEQQRKVAVRLERVCEFGFMHDQQRPKQCRDSDYNPENNYRPEGFVVVKFGGDADEDLVKCKPGQRKNRACPDVVEPVCAALASPGPAGGTQQYDNDCEACAEPNVVGYRKGPCK